MLTAPTQLSLFKNRCRKFGHEPYKKQPPFIANLKGNDLSINNEYKSVSWSI